MNVVNPTSWRFYVGSFVPAAAADLADTRDIATLKRATQDACTPGPTFDPSRCSRLAQMLGRAQTQYNCYSGQPLLGAGGSGEQQSASAAVPSSAQILAATNTAGMGITNAATAALGAPLNNQICKR